MITENILKENFEDLFKYAIKEKNDKLLLSMINICDQEKIIDDLIEYGNVELIIKFLKNGHEKNIFNNNFSTLISTFQKTIKFNNTELNNLTKDILNKKIYSEIDSFNKKQIIPDLGKSHIGWLVNQKNPEKESIVDSIGQKQIIPDLEKRPLIEKESINELPIIESLIDHRVINSSTLLLHAIKCKDKILLKFLIKKNYDADSYYTIFNQNNLESIIFLAEFDNLNKLLLEASKYGTLESIKLLVEKGADNLNEALLCVSKRNIKDTLESIKFLVEKGANNLNEALKYTTINNCYDINIESIKFLVEKGANNLKEALINVSYNINDKSSHSINYLKQKINEEELKKNKDTTNVDLVHHIYTYTPYIDHMKASEH